MFCNNLVAALASAVMAQNTACVKPCPASFVSTAVCGALKISDSNFEYKDFSGNCYLSNENCGLTNRKISSLNIAFITI